MSFGSPRKNPKIGGNIPEDSESFNVQGGPGAGGGQDPENGDPVVQQHWLGLGWSHDPENGDTVVQQHWCCIKGGRWKSWVNPNGMGHMEWDARWHCKKCLPRVPPVCPGGQASVAGGPPPPQTECNWKTKQECSKRCITPDFTEAGRITGGGGGGGSGSGGGKGQCKDFACMKNGGGNFQIGKSTFDEDDRGNLTEHGKTQKKFMRALMRPESVMDAVDCDSAGQPEGCVEGGLYGLRGDPPNPGTLVNGRWRNLHPHNLFMEGTAKGCLQIRQPYHWDALEWWGGTKTCPERFDYPDPEETDGKPEGFAWLESYEVACKKYWMGLGGMAPPADGSYANNQSDLSIPPGSYPMPYTNPDKCTTHPANAGWSYPQGGGGIHSYRYRPAHSTHAQWNQREPACDFMPGPSDAPWVNPRTGEAGEQYPRPGDGALSPPNPRHWVYKAGRGEWTKDCACRYSQWVASMYMQRYTNYRFKRGCLLHHQAGDQNELLRVDHWGNAATFAPATLCRMHHIGGVTARKCEPTNGWDSRPGHENESEHQRKAMWQWVAEHCGEADAAAQATSPCRAAAVTAWHANEIGNTAVSYDPNAGSQGGAW